MSVALGYSAVRRKQGAGSGRMRGGDPKTGFPFSRPVNPVNKSAAPRSLAAATMANTRMVPILPQDKVVVTANTRPDEAEWRAQQAKLGTGKVYTEAGLATSTDLLPKHGMPGVFIAPRRGKKIPGNLGGHLSEARFVTNTNGLPLDYEIIGTGFTQSDHHAGNGQVTVSINGTDTIVNMHTGPVFLGDHLFVDPFPEVTADGRARVYGPEGVAPSVHNIVLKPCNPVDFYASITELQRALMEHGRTRKKGTLQDGLASLDSAEAFDKLVGGTCDTFFSDVNQVTLQDPIQLYARLWLAKTVVSMLVLFSLEGKATSKQVLCGVRGLLLTIKALVRFNREEVKRFDEFLPKFAFSGRIAAEQDGVFTALEVEVPATFLDEAHTPTASEVLKTKEICELVATSQLQALTQRVQDHRKRLFGGTALSSAPSAHKFDYFIRR